VDMENPFDQVDQVVAVEVVCYTLIVLEDMVMMRRIEIGEVAEMATEVVLGILGVKGSVVVQVAD
jgi:hypothetical protein